jgi:hypothetical protein
MKTFVFRRLPDSGADLEALAQRLGVSLFNTWVTKNGKTGLDTAEVQRRILDAIRARRDSWLWPDSLHFVPRLPRQRYHRVVGGESSPLTGQYTVIYQ